MSSFLGSVFCRIQRLSVLIAVLALVSGRGVGLSVLPLSPRPDLPKVSQPPPRFAEPAPRAGAGGAGVFPTPAAGISVIVSVADQKMVLWRAGAELARFSISTSRFGLGDRSGSYATPLGALQVAAKIGQGVKEGTVFKERRPTQEVLAPNAPGRDPIVTRIVWLKGLETQNANSYSRYIYIHGTPEERLLGTPVSWGCVRMASKDVVKLFESIDIGTRVEILDKPMKAILKEHAVMDRLAQNSRS